MVLRRWEWTTVRRLVFFPFRFPSFFSFNHFPNEQNLWLLCVVEHGLPTYCSCLPGLWPYRWDPLRALESVVVHL